MLGLLVGLGSVAAAHLLEMPVFDGIASVVIGLILGATAVWLAFETKGLLIGESARRETVEWIRKAAGRLRGVEDVNDVLTMHMGPDDVLLNVALDFRDDLSAAEVESRSRSSSAWCGAACPRSGGCSSRRSPCAGGSAALDRAASPQKPVSSPSMLRRLRSAR